MMWNLGLPDFSHAILVPMDTPTDMVMDTVTGKGEINPKADGGKYFHLYENVHKVMCAEVLPCCSNKKELLHRNTK